MKLSSAHSGFDPVWLFCGCLLIAFCAPDAVTQVLACQGLNALIQAEDGGVAVPQDN